MGSSSKAQTVGYKYYMGVHIAMCHGEIDEVREFICGERSAWSGSVTGNSTIVVDRGDLFGGDNREGGVAGLIDFCMGGPTQGKNPYLMTQISPVPTYRGLATAVFRGFDGGAGGGGFMWSSGNPYFKAPWMRVYRALKGWDGPVWYPEKAKIGTRDMNPAHIIYEALTNSQWGMGYSAEDIIDAEWRATADKLYDENFGLALMWMEATSIDDFVQMIVNHINGVLVTDLRTGKFRLKLIRNDYDVNTLPTLDEDNVIELTSFQRTAWGNTVNEVVVKYTDRDQNEATVTLHDLASIQAQGRVVSTNKEYLAARDESLAARLGQRDLDLASATLSKITLVCTRVAWDWERTDVFKFSWARRNIQGVPYRIVKIDKGNLVNGQITIEAVEDVFGMPTTAYIENQPGGWVDTAKPPVPVAAMKVYEAPYYDIVQGFSAADIAYFPPGYAYGEIAAARPTSVTFGYEIHAANPGGDYANVASGEFTPTGTIPKAIPVGAEPVTLTMNGGFDLSLDLVDTYAYIDNEAFKVTTINPVSAEVTLQRATIDTVPAAHVAGSRVWFVDDLAGYDPVQRTSGEVVNYRALTRTGLGTLPLLEATPYQMTFFGRADRPYPPGRVQVNFAYYPSMILGNINLSWAHRDRLQQTAGLVDFRTASIGPEAGTTYSVMVYDGATLKRTYVGITGTSWVYSMTDAIADGTKSRVRVVLSSARDGLSSWQAHDINVERAGFGFRFGQQFGGI